MRAMHINDIGAAVVTFPFRMGEKWLRSGTQLTHDQLAKMGTANRNSLIDKNYIYCVPKSMMGKTISVPISMPTDRQERHIVSRGFGRFDVIEGRKLNDEPLGKEAATVLAASG